MREVVGIELINYTSRKTGKLVDGYKLYFPLEKENCDGLCTESEFVKKELCQNVKVGDKIQLFYNKFGQVTEVSIS